MIDYSLYLVTDNPSRYAGNWLDNVAAAIEGGVTCVQYRDTESAPQEQYRRVLALKDVLKRRDANSSIPLIVNNDAQLAAAVAAEGVHVGQADLPPGRVRAIVGPRCEIGLSITDQGQLAAVDFSVVNALGIGPVFDARKTKSDAAAAMGLAGLKEIVAAVASRPVATVAIGGITLENAAAVRATGVNGLAVVSAFSKAPDPASVARCFVTLGPISNEKT